MYKIKKKMEISGAHHLTLDYPSKCTRIHGHNWKVTVYCASNVLDSNGMVIDFTHIKEKIESKLDHRLIDEVIDKNPTAENMAKWIHDELQPTCYKVKVKESSGNVAIYEAELLGHLLSGYKPI